MSRWPRARDSVVLWAPSVILVLVVLVPVGALAGDLLAGEAALQRLRSVLGTAQTWALLGRSVALAGGVTVIAAAIGIPLGVLLGRTDVTARGWLLFVHAFPMFIPPFLVALGWFHVFGLNGYLGSAASARVLFGPVGLLLILGSLFAPIVTCLTALALRNVDPSLEEAARVVARPLRVVVRILLPTAFPAIALALLLVFALALSELAVPMFLRVRTYPASVMARLGGIDFAPGEAVALVVPLFAVTLVLLAVERRLVGERTFAVFGLRSAERAVFPLGRWRVLATMVCAGGALVSLVPLLALAIRAVPDGIVALPQWMRSSLWNSLTAAVGGATAATVLGVSAAWRLARSQRAGRLVDAALMLGFLTPAAALGVGLITAWNHEVTRAIYGGVTILILGLLARYAVVAVRVIATAIAQSPRSLEDAAAVFGAGPVRQLRRIVAPLHGRGIVAAWLFTLIFCIRDLDTVVLFYPPGREPLTVRIFTLEANGPEAVVAALSLTQILLTALLIGLAAAVATRGRRDAR